MIYIRWYFTDQFVYRDPVCCRRPVKVIGEEIEYVDEADETTIRNLTESDDDGCFHKIKWQARNNTVFYREVSSVSQCGNQCDKLQKGASRVIVHYCHSISYRNSTGNNSIASFCLLSDIDSSEFRESITRLKDANNRIYWIWVVDVDIKDWDMHEQVCNQSSLITTATKVLNSSSTTDTTYQEEYYFYEDDRENGGCSHAIKWPGLTYSSSLLNNVTIFGKEVSLTQCANRCDQFQGAGGACRQFSYRNSTGNSSQPFNCLLSSLDVSEIIPTADLKQDQDWDIYEQVCNESSLVPTTTPAPTILTSPTPTDTEYYDGVRYGTIYDIRIDTINFPTSTTTRSSTNTSSNSTFRKRRSVDDDNLFSASFSFNISITNESLVSILLLQLPGVCLGIFGIIKAFQIHGFNEDGCKSAAR